MKAPKPVWDFAQFAAFVPASGWIHDYVKYACKCTDAPPLYHIAGSLGVGSVALAPHMDLVLHGRRHPLHLFLLIIGGSSDSRKTSSLSRVYRVAEPVFTNVSHRGARLWRPVLSSPEGILQELANEPNRLMFQSEWTALHRMSEASYSKHAAELLNLIFDAEDVARARARDNITVTRPRLSILGASTPSLIQESVPRPDWEAGKMARYLICPMDKPAEADMPVDVDYPAEIEACRLALQRLVVPNPAITEATLSDEAWEALQEWRSSPQWRSLRERAPEHLQPSFARAPANLMRVAVIYQCSETFPYSATVTRDTMLRAINLMMWTYTELVKTFPVVNEVDHAGLRRVRNLIAAAGDQGMSRSELLRKSHLKARVLDEAIETLYERGEVRGVRTGRMNASSRPVFWYYYIPVADRRD